MGEIKLKILGVTPFVWSKGAVPSLYEVQEEFAKMGHEVHLVAPDINPFMLSSKKSFDKSTSKIFVHHFRFPHRFCSYFEKLQSTLKTNSKAYFLVGAVKVIILFFFFVLLGIIKTWKVAENVVPDVIYGHTYIGVLPAFLVSRIRKIPCVTRCYGVPIQGITDSKDALKVSTLNLLISPNILFLRIPTDMAIITNDGTGGYGVAKRIGVSPSKIRFWRNGINKQVARIHFDKRKIRKKIHISPDIKIITSINRLVDLKRVDRIITAMPSIVAKYPKVICLIIGEGPERDKLEKLSHELGMGAYVRFIGEVSHREVFEYLSISNIFVALSDLSNVSNSMLEAMICGKCIMALDMGWTSEVIKDGENGILVDKDELEYLPNVIVGLLNNPEFGLKLGKNVQTHAFANLWAWKERAEVEIKEVQKLVLGNRKSKDKKLIIKSTKGG